ncbi:hypothetical protein PR202_ga20333 [Eleusine coracana subsp. coracana]|uniref:F-box domain-containing protein n=1 Tax=Eleusine coracana subsp. coracana TaxID=191504 RepID=A0AAV5CWG4_ELECO|nr:hypothetical protein PR202_ga20333 [Eleusine coracana subsp. coracana]
MPTPRRPCGRLPDSLDIRPTFLYPSAPQSSSSISVLLARSACLTERRCSSSRGRGRGAVGRKAKREELKKGKGRRDGAMLETAACLACKPCKHMLCSMSPSLPDDLVPDILLRVPPDDPAGLVQASTARKAWRRIVTDPSFSTHYRALHRHKRPPCSGGCCDHRSCSGGPFIVAFAGVEHINMFGDINYLGAHAEFYSSETRNRGLNINIHLEYEKFDLEVDRPTVLVGDSLYFVYYNTCRSEPNRTSPKSGFLLRYWYGPLLQLGYKKMLEAGIYSSEIVTVIEPPKAKNLGKVIAMMADDDDLSLASLCRDKISMWARKTGMDGLAGWAHPVIFVSTEDGILTIDLKSSQARKVSEMGNDVKIIYPFVSFYTETLLVGNLNVSP